MRFLFSLALLSSFAFAGNGSSGGGNIYGDQINPWFLQNTTKVKYCVQISDEFSQLPKEKILSFIQDALSFWKNKFANEEPLGQGLIPTPVVATQDFIYSDCTPDTDLKFQFGVLAPNQKSNFANFDQIVGMAYRETYDQVNMRGTGFIYIAPERGPLRPSSPSFSDRPWSSEVKGEQPLLLAIAHELGHVFGIQDDYVTLSFDIMGAHFVEELVRDGRDFMPLKYHQPLSAEGTYYNNMFYSGGDFSKEVRDFLGIPEGIQLLKLQGEGRKVKVLAASGGMRGSVQEMGTIILSPGYEKQRNSTYVSKVKIWLPLTQKVFTYAIDWSKEPRYNSIYITSSSYILKDMVYEKVDGSKKRVDCAVGNGNFSMNAMINGKYIFNLLSGGH